MLEYLTLERNAPQGTRNFLELENGRLYSGDGNLNWRLQIWQDVFLISHPQDSFYLDMDLTIIFPRWKILCLDTMEGPD